MWHDWKGVTEPDWYWWWNGDEDCCGVPVYVSGSWSGSGYDYFATMGQLGWNRAQSVEEMGGLWCRATPPPLPEVCEHGVKEGDYCEPCNKEYKAAMVDPENHPPSE